MPICKSCALRSSLFVCSGPQHAAAAAILDSNSYFHDRACGGLVMIKKLGPLADPKDLIFGGWDIFKDNAFQASAKAGVLSTEHLGQVKTFLSGIRPMKAAFDHEYVKKLDGAHVKKEKNKYELALQIKEDIANFKKTRRVSRLVTCW